MALRLLQESAPAWAMVEDGSSDGRFRRGTWLQLARIGGRLTGLARWMTQTWMIGLCVALWATTSAHNLSRAGSRRAIRATWRR